MARHKVDLTRINVLTHGKAKGSNKYADAPYTAFYGVFEQDKLNFAGQMIGHGPAEGEDKEMVETMDPWPPPSQWLPFRVRDASEREYDRQSLISSFKVVAADALRAYYPRPDVCGPSDPKLSEYHNPTWNNRNCYFQLAENYIGHQQSPPPPPSTTLDHPPITNHQ